jgi:hypothetical protein
MVTFNFDNAVVPGCRGVQQVVRKWFVSSGQRVDGAHLWLREQPNSELRSSIIVSVHQLYSSATSHFNETAARIAERSDSRMNRKTKMGRKEQLDEVRIRFVPLVKHECCQTMPLEQPQFIGSTDLDHLSCHLRGELLALADAPSDTVWVRLKVF